MPERWLPLPGCDLQPITVEPHETDGDGNVTRYRVWIAGRPEPAGNPVKWSPKTLREFYEPERERKR